MVRVILEEDHSIGTHSSTPVAEGAYCCLPFEEARVFRPSVDKNEVVSGAGHLPERQPLQFHQTLPVMDHQRRRHTIQTASRTIFFDILLVPSVLSTNTMGISTIRKPFRQTLKCISI